MRRSVFLLAVLAAMFWLLTGSSLRAGGTYSGKTILWVDSYTAGYPWSDGVERGLRRALEGSGARFEVFRMDMNSRFTSKEKRAIGAKALERVKTLKADLVIASDDAAQEFLVVPYLKDTDLPVVFCGVNWDASLYGYPAKNVTGMIEVEGVEEMVRFLRRDAKGPRIGYISGETSSDFKISSILNARFFDGAMRTYFVEDFEEFKRVFRKAQLETDMLFVRNYAGIEGWENEEARAFLAANTRIPTASPLDFMADFVLYDIGKIPEEQGEWAASAALRILGGEKPSDIPMVENQKVLRTVNLDMARAAGVTLPEALLSSAKVLGRPQGGQGSAP